MTPAAKPGHRIGAMSSIVHSGYLNPRTQYHSARPSRRRQYKHLCLHFVYKSDSVDFGGSLPELALSITDGQKLHRHPSVVAVLL
jgi:hypothetical protein